MEALETKLKIAELERGALAAKIEKIENKMDQVKEKMGDMEKEIELSIEKAVRDVKGDMDAEMKEREERSVNIVMYGVEESQQENVEERKSYNIERAQAVGVEAEGKLEVKFRAGKKGEKPRPMIVKVADEEVRERLLRNARELAK